MFAQRRNTSLRDAPGSVEKRKKKKIIACSFIKLPFLYKHLGVLAYATSVHMFQEHKLNVSGVRFY